MPLVIPTFLPLASEHLEITQLMELWFLINITPDWLFIFQRFKAAAADT